MGMPVKLSDELVLAARMEAEATDRTITSQIEHWAKLGRAAEAQLSYGEVVRLKLGAAGTADKSDAREALLSRLEDVARGEAGRDSVLATLRAQGRPIYEAASDQPGFVVRIDPDGTRTVGRFEGRQFVARDPAPARRRKVASR